MNHSNLNLGTESAEARDSRRELNVLWTKAHAVVSGYIRSTVIDFHRAEDVLQETAATVAEKFDEYDSSRPFNPWALGIARNKVLDALRKSARDRLVFDESVVTQLSMTYADLQTDASEIHIALEHCVERVKGRSRKLLEMRYLRDQTADAIAAATGMTAGAVAVALHRIRKALHDCIEQQTSVKAASQPSQGGS
ncbi:MAG: sigma-70 family RNA polymerase sigma factor [Aeoliella sp.]